MQEIFKDEQFVADDNFMDIGCGKARVIAYLLKNNFLGKVNAWIMHKREWIFKKHGFYVSRCPQRYSIWTYTPANCRIDYN